MKNIKYIRELRQLDSDVKIQTDDDDGRTILYLDTRFAGALITALDEYLDSLSPYESNEQMQAAYAIDELQEIYDNENRAYLILIPSRVNCLKTVIKENASADQASLNKIETVLDTHS